MDSAGGVGSASLALRGGVPRLAAPSPPRLHPWTGATGGHVEARWRFTVCDERRDPASAHTKPELSCALSRKARSSPIPAASWVCRGCCKKPHLIAKGRLCLRAGAAALISGDQSSRDYGLFPCSHLSIKAKPKMGETSRF